MIINKTYVLIGILITVAFIGILFFAGVKYKEKLANCQSKGGVLVKQHSGPLRGTYVCIICIKQAWRSFRIDSVLGVDA